MKYGIIPDLTKKLHQAMADGDNTLSKEIVSENDISIIIPRITGILIDTMLSSEREILLAMEDKLRQSLIGQGG